MSRAQLFDDLARTLAEPMPRRRALRVIGTSLAVVLVPGVRPRMVRAAPLSRSSKCGKDVRECPRLVGPGTGEPWCCGKPALQYECGDARTEPDVCRNRCPSGVPCPSDRKDDEGYTLDFICCKPPLGTLCCKGTCCDPKTQRCGKVTDGLGSCEGLCPPERSGCGVCCAVGQYCSPSRGKCCPPDQDRSCRGPAPDSDCKRKADELVDFYELKVCRKSGKGNASTSSSGASATGIPSLQEAAWSSLGCFAYAEAILRPSEYGRCKQEADDTLCPSGVRCDPASGLCMSPLCDSRLPASDRRSTASASRHGLRSRSGTASVSGPASVLTELRKHKSVLGADAVRLGKALEKKPTAARSRSLASALKRYRADVDALRASVKTIATNDPSARPAAQAVLTTFGYGSAGLESFTAAVSTGRKAKAMRLGRQAKQSFKKADASSRKARKALGCGSTC